MSLDLLCFSHLRWDFVYQRPNHLMTRAARDRRVFFIEEPQPQSFARPSMTFARRGDVIVATPHLPVDLDEDSACQTLTALMDGLVQNERIDGPALWYYTPMALPWTRQLSSSITAYDSMDYLPGFLGASPGLLSLEAELLERADLVFTGGAQLQKRMAHRHKAAYCFPSSVDVAHFGAARNPQPEPIDQAPIPRPRLGYAGVIDERIDLPLIAGVADRRPGWQIVLVGPVAKVDPNTIPARPNIHRLGMKSYAELPGYLSGWDMGWMPFARNDATRYISPTKTPEYLAAGLPVVSTGIRDVIVPYQRHRLVEIADDVDTTIAAIERALASDVATHRRRVDAFLASRSWDRTWAAMEVFLNKKSAGWSMHRRPSEPVVKPPPDQRGAARSPHAAGARPPASART